MAHHLLMSETAHVEVDLDGQRHRFGWPRTHGLILVGQARPASADMHIEF